MKTFKDFLKEDGAAAGVGGGTTCANIAGSGSPELPASQREPPGVPPGVTSKKKKSPVMFKLPITRKRYNG